MQAITLIYNPHLFFNGLCSAYSLWVPQKKWQIFILELQKWLENPSIPLFWGTDYLWLQNMLATNVLFYSHIRVAKVVTVHNDLLTQWRPIKMSKFCANIFWYKLLPTTYGPQKFPKNRVFKVDYFILTLFFERKLRSVAQND